MKNDFESFYENFNNEDIQEQFQTIKSKRSKRVKIAIIIIILIDIAVWFALNKIISTFEIFQIVFMIVPCLILDIIIYAVITYGASSEYNKLFKEKIIDNLLKNFFTDVDYIPKKEMPSSIYEEGKYNEYYNRYYSDDYMEAYIDDKYLIKMAEITTEMEETKTDSDGDTTTETTTIFSGLFAKINIGKSIKNELRIGENSLFHGKNRLDMDSQEFEKHFDVISTDKIIGMQLLTHDIMDLLIEYRKKLKKIFDIVIINDIMYVRLHVGNMFEAKIKRKSTIDRNIVEKYYDIVNFIYSLSKMMINVVEDTEI